MVHTPHRDKLEGTKRSLDLLREQGFPPEMTIIDHNNELTVELLADTGVNISFLRMLRLLRLLRLLKAWPGLYKIVMAFVKSERQLTLGKRPGLLPRVTLGPA